MTWWKTIMDLTPLFSVFFQFEKLETRLKIGIVHREQVLRKRSWECHSCCCCYFTFVKFDFARYSGKLMDLQAMNLFSKWIQIMVALIIFWKNEIWLARCHEINLFLFTLNFSHMTMTLKIQFLAFKLLFC